MLVPVNPLRPPPDWQDLSPLGKMPILRSSELTDADSSVICQYLERIRPAASLRPSEPAELARAPSIEEFVDYFDAMNAFGERAASRPTHSPNVT